MSCLTTSNVPWFMDLTFQVPMQYCSLQHQTLLPSPVTSKTGLCFHFGSVSLFFLELFIHSSPVVYWAHTDLRSSSFSVISFCLFILFMEESSDKMWSTGEGNSKSLQYSCLENTMNSMKKQNVMTLKDELPKSVSAQNATGEQWRINSRKNKEMKPRQKQHPVADVTGDRSKVRCCKEQYCIGTWNVRSMNQGKLEVVKQKMARVNVDILGTNKLK